MKCKHCGAEVSSNERKCPYCNSEMDVQPTNESKAGCPKCGSQNIKFSRESVGTNRTYTTKRGILLKNTKTGRSTQTTSYRTIGLCQNCGYSWEVNASGNQKTSHGFWWWALVIMFLPIAAAIYIIKNYDKQPRDVWWWISAVLAFPITISLWIYKTDKIKISKWLRIAIIAVFWIVLFLISPSSDTNNQEAEGDTIETETTAEQVTESVSETTIAETIVESTAPETQPETTVPETTIVATEKETTTETTQVETTMAVTQAETTVAETTAAETTSEMVVEETVAAETQPVVVETQPETTVNESETEGNISSNSGNYSTNDGIIPHTESDTCAINSETKKYHQFNCGTAYNAWKNGSVVTTKESIDSLRSQGYKPCGNCH